MAGAERARARHHLPPDAGAGPHRPVRLHPCRRTGRCQSAPDSAPRSASKFDPRGSGCGSHLHAKVTSREGPRGVEPSSGAAAPGPSLAVRRAVERCVDLHDARSLADIPADLHAFKARWRLDGFDPKHFRTEAAYKAWRRKVIAAIRATTGAFAAKAARVAKVDAWAALIAADSTMPLRPRSARRISAPGRTASASAGRARAAATLGRAGWLYGWSRRAPGGMARLAAGAVP